MRVLKILGRKVSLLPIGPNLVDWLQGGQRLSWAKDGSKIVWLNSTE